jgi:integrase
MALTDVKIRSARFASKPYKLTDGRGLYLLVTPSGSEAQEGRTSAEDNISPADKPPVINEKLSGSKLWRWNYRYQGRQKTMPLGRYPDVSLSEARIAHNDARKALATGNDPMAKRKADKAYVRAQAKVVKSLQTRAKGDETIDERSFKAVALKWHENWKSGVSADTEAYILRRLEADVFPAFGHKLMSEVKPSDIRQLIVSIQDGKGEGRRFEGKGARDVAQRQQGTINQIFRYAIAHQLVDENPAAAFKSSDVLKARISQNRARVEVSQIPELLVAIDEYSGDKVRRAALQLMSMLFVRTNELLEAPLTEFDLDNARWVISKERMKMRHPHIVPLPRQAVAILRELFSLAATEHKRYVFPGMNKQTENGTVNENTLLNALEEIGYKSVMTGHGFRGLASTILHEADFEDPHIELQLSHGKKNKVAASYDYAKYLPQRTKLMQWWANYLDEALKKGKAKRSALPKSA